MGGERANITLQRGGETATPRGPRRGVSLQRMRKRFRAGAQRGSEFSFHEREHRASAGFDGASNPRNAMISSLLLTLPLAAPALSARDVSGAFPEDTLVYLEAPGLAGLLDEGLDHPLVEQLLESPIAQAALEDAPLRPAQANLFRVSRIPLGAPMPLRSRWPASPTPASQSTS